MSEPSAMADVWVAFSHTIASTVMPPSIRLPTELVETIASESVNDCFTCMKTHAGPRGRRAGAAVIKRACADMANQRKVNSLFKDAIDRRWKQLMRNRDTEGTFLKILHNEHLWENAINSFYYMADLWQQVHPQRSIMDVGHLFAQLTTAPLPQAIDVLKGVVTHDVRAFLPSTNLPEVQPLVDRLLSEPELPSDVLRAFLGWLSDAPALHDRILFTNIAALRTADDVKSILEYRLFKREQILSEIAEVTEHFETGALSTLYNELPEFELWGANLSARHLLDLLENSPRFVQDFLTSYQLKEWFITGFLQSFNGGDLAAELVNVFPTDRWLAAQGTNPEEAARSLLYAIWCVVRDHPEITHWSPLERIPLIHDVAALLPPTFMIDDDLLWRPDANQVVSRILMRVFHKNASEHVRQLEDAFASGQVL
ncbi:hypothetical protein DFJ74DRAFT_682698 [Hyaloraphidium curvatum]|nr:hypothetical protein DFJ74DRAFT_682698 [Hyaloraphidium curvatum]